MDPRVVDLPLIASSYYVPLVIFSYLYFVLRCGPRFMKDKPPYSLKTFMQLYNIIQILANLYVVYDSIVAGLFTNTKLLCPKQEFSYDYTLLRITRRSMYWYFLLKILDYVETGMFVLRKKNKQVTGLHLYHHVSTLLFSWLGLRYMSFVPSMLFAIANSSIHVIMYTYYYLAARGPNVQKLILPLKPWITKMQMIQFVALIVYSTQNFFPGCKMAPHWVAVIFITNLIINFSLFYNFYQKAYNKHKKIK